MIPKAVNNELIHQLRRESLPLKVLRSIIFANLFITLCALVMSLYTSVLFSLNINIYLLVFTISGTLCSYSFHWLLPSAHTKPSPRENWSRSHRILLFILFSAGAAGSVYSMFFLTGYLPALLPLVILTFLYSSGKLPRGPFVLFRKYFIGKTIYLALMWSLVTVYLPVIISNTAWNISDTLFLINRFFFLFAICILFDLRDKELDKLQGIKSLITMLPGSQIKKLFFISLFISLITGLSLKNYGFTALDLIILNIPVILTALLYNFSTQTRSELWFYFILDGIMMLSGIIVIILSFLKM